MHWQSYILAHFMFGHNFMFGHVHIDIVYDSALFMFWHNLRFANNIRLKIHYCVDKFNITIQSFHLQVRLEHYKGILKCG